MDRDQGLRSGDFFPLPFLFFFFFRNTCAYQGRAIEVTPVSPI